MTETRKVNVLKVNLSVVQEAAQIIKAGGVVAYPTDSLYALGVDPFNPDALKKLFDLKGRPHGKPMALIAGSEETLEGLCLVFSQKALELKRAFWPGPLTLILPTSVPLSPLITGGKASVGIRIPDCSWAREISKRVKGPITATSVNPSGKEPAHTLQEIMTYFPTGIDLILDAGVSLGGKVSTLLDMTQEPPTIIREGAITRAQIEGILGRVAA